MADYRDHHATIFLPPEVAGSIEAVRRAWDPDMATRIAAHVTLVYPQEASDPILLTERLVESSGHFKAFRLRLGGIGSFGRPEDGVFANVEDVDGGYLTLREHLLQPPFHRLAVPAHATLVHPLTSRRGREFWDRGAYRPSTLQFVVREIAVTAFAGVRWETIGTYRLDSSERQVGSHRAR